MQKLSKDKLYYLASPYSHKSEIVRAMRKFLVDAVGSQLVAQGIHVFGPITESACYTKMEPTLDGAWDFWKAHDLLMLDRCDAMLVLTLKGWAQSVGVSAEIKYAKERGLDVLFLDVDEMLPHLKEAI